MLTEILHEYDPLTTACRELLETEIATSRAGNAETAGPILERKRALMDQLDELLRRLKRVREQPGQNHGIDREQVNFLQQKFMQILKLDRELEKQLLSNSVRSPQARLDSPERPMLAARLYQQNNLSMSRT